MKLAHFLQPGGASEAPLEDVDHSPSPPGGTLGQQGRGLILSISKVWSVEKAISGGSATVGFEDLDRWSADAAMRRYRGVIGEFDTALSWGPVFP